jgi:predicted kinase
MPPECVLLIGLPGAGKTTFYRQRFEGTHAHISRDVMAAGAQRAGGRLDELDRQLRERLSVVVDDTNVTARDRAAVVDRAKSAGARVVGYFFDVTTRAAVARNAQRTGSARVPNVAIFTSAKRLERPSLSEGFDELHVVRVNRDGSTVVDE